MSQCSRVLFLLFVLHACLPVLTTAPLLAQANSGEPVNLAVMIEGQVNVKRSGWTAYAPVVFGTDLTAGDLLNLGEASRVKVVCSDLTLRDVLTGLGGVPCSTSPPLLRRAGGSLVNPTRSWPNDGSFPVVLAPRRTKLISDHPLLRWTALKGATAYRVTIRGEKFHWSTVVKSGNELAYPDSAPRLEPGVDYKLIVDANDGSSSDEAGLGLGFSILSSKDKKTVSLERKRVETLGLPEGPTQFLIAHIYAVHRLYAEAIESLEKTSRNFRAAAVERLLGDLYMDVGLARQGETHYLQSLDLATKEKDEEGQMIVHKDLAYIYGEILGNKETANRHLEATLGLARKLGDDQTATQMVKQLAELK